MTKDEALHDAIEARCRAEVARELADKLVKTLESAPPETLDRLTVDLQEYATDLVYLATRIARYTGANLRWRVVEQVIRPADLAEGDERRGVR